MKDKASLAFWALLTLAISMAWLNASHLMDAILNLQPGLPPRLTMHGVEILQKGSVSPIVAPILGFKFSAAIAFSVAFRNLVVTERPWLRMAMFLATICLVLTCWWVLQFKLMVVNPANVSDPEIAGWTRTGLLSLQASFERGGQPAALSFGIWLVAYTCGIAWLAYPESKSNSSGHGVRSSLRR